MTQSEISNGRPPISTSSPIFNMDRYALQDQHDRMSETIRSQLLPAFAGIDGKLSHYSAELDAQPIASDAPEFQESEHKAELHALYEDQLRSAQCDAAALAVAMLYHQWERATKWLIARKYCPDEVDGLASADFKKLKQLLGYSQFAPACRVAMDQIDLGRLIANVVKHGTGNSADELQARAPHLFEKPWSDSNFHLPSGIGTNVIWVGPEAVDNIAAAIDTFWQTLPDDRFPPARPPSLEAFLNGDD